MIVNAEEDLAKYFSKMNLDLRKSKFSRFMDQKVTPDVLCFIADCIINLPDNSRFTTKDIWASDYFEKNVRAIFGKPSPANKKAQNEYDKFIIQPLRMLFYSGVLDSQQKGQKYIYSVNQPNLLEYISIKERNSYLFLYYYLIKVLADSGIIQYFEKFKENDNKDNFKLLKDKFARFLKGNTEISGDYEPARIFPKILNIYSVHNEINGTERGFLSKHNFNFSDLMYNRENWRDVGKAKGLTRTESTDGGVVTQRKIFHTYLINKAKERIRRKYQESEVKDSFGKGTASHIHHIFPMSEYPQLAVYLENLIKITASQHLEKAHTKGNTQIVNKDYQCVCLLAKSQSVEDSLNKGEVFYTKPNFVYVVNEGLKISLTTSIDFGKIRHEINKAYNKG